MYVNLTESYLWQGFFLLKNDSCDTDQSIIAPWTFIDFLFLNVIAVSNLKRLKIRVHEQNFFNLLTERVVNVDLPLENALE